MALFVLKNVIKQTHKTNTIINHLKALDVIHLISLILGGARSGKSNFAESIATRWYQASTETAKKTACQNACPNSAPPNKRNTHYQLHYIATAEAFDTEMEKRIELHQASRISDWQLHEVPLNLVEKLKVLDAPNNIILVDCLTLWLNNQLYNKPDQNWTELFNTLSRATAHLQSHIIFVSNEVGLGIVPGSDVSRIFVDEAGRLNQCIAQISDTVVFMISGIAQCIKGEIHDRI